MIQQTFYPKWFLNEFPALRVDIVLSTHAHFDHDAVERPSGLMVLERLVGQFKLGDIEITGLADTNVNRRLLTSRVVPLYRSM